MLVNLASYVPVSTVDDFGYSTSVIFFRGCDMPCWFCHNAEYKSGDTFVDVSKLEEWLFRDDILTSSVTLSGGEPLLQPAAVKHIAECAHKLGKKVCLYTSGNHPNELKEVISYIDRIYIDFKSESIGLEQQNYDSYLKKFIRCISICEENNIETTVTSVVFDTREETINELEDIKCFIGDSKFMVIQGILKNSRLSPEIMKRWFKNCYIRTVENGVEWND